MQKEPLSRSLKGRPFEHEEFYEILYPDVVGSGGAPKRVTKPRRRGADASPGDGDQDTPGTTILHLLNDSYAPTAQTAAAPLSARPSTGVAATAVQPRPTQAIIPPRGVVASTSALTPPDETTPQSRKRFLPPDVTSNSATDKRRRAAAAGSSSGRNANNSSNKTNSAGASGNSNANSASNAASNNYIDLTHPAQQAAAAAAARGDSIGILADALTRATAASAPPRYPEQAMDIFFRDFAAEDMDLQVKIAEKMLTDPNKAVLFVKMPPELRKHWVKRLREAHNRVGN